jgi:thioredoxin-related protein
MKYFALSFLLFAAITAHTQTPPPTAEQVIKQACEKASAEHKKVYVIFNASWCTWCHRKDKSMQDPVCKKYFDDNFVTCHLVVDESSDKKQLENPGANELRNQYKGNGLGIPFWAILDKEGKVIADAKIPVNNNGSMEFENAGCPATEKEVEFFIGLLKKTTSLSEAELAVIRKRFRENEH